ncbi:MAG: alpha-2-macroglobulin family protein [Planctomycetaceae bacterium]
MLHRCFVALLLALTATGFSPEAQTCQVQESPDDASKKPDLAVLRSTAETEFQLYHSSERVERLLQLSRQILSHPENTGESLVNDLGRVLELCDDFDLYDETFEYCELVVAAHPKEWKVRLALCNVQPLTPANFYYWLADEGIRIGPGFYRGYGAGMENGAGVSFVDHDRVWRLQRLLEAIRLMEADPAVTAVNLADAYETLAETIGGFRYEFHRSLQRLTDLNQIPPPIEFDQEPWSVSRGNLKLNDQGQIVGLQFPVSWEEARTDAERWCWALEQAVKFDPPRRSRLELLRASYVDSIVGISQTFPARADESGGVAPAFEAPAFGKMAVAQVTKAEIRSLPDSDTYISTPAGLQRITLDPEFNPILLLQRILERRDSERTDALSALLQIRMNRHQFGSVAASLELEIAQLEAELKSLREANPAEQYVFLENDLTNLRTTHELIHSTRKEMKLPDVRRITKTGTGGSKVPVTLTFRNSTSATFRLHAIDLEKVLQGIVSEDFKDVPIQNRQSTLDVLYQGRGRLEQQCLSTLENLKLLPHAAKEWTVPLVPRPEHELTTTTIDVALEGPAAWVLTVGDGHSIDDIYFYWEAPAEFLIWPHNKSGYLGFLADRTTGRPISNAEVHLAHYQQGSAEPSTQESITKILTDQNGLFTLPENSEVKTATFVYCRREEQIVALGEFRESFEDTERRRAETDVRQRFASRVKSAIVTDRAIYRPGDTVKMHFWTGRPFERLNPIPGDAAATVLITSDSDHFVVDGQSRNGGYTSEWTIPVDTRSGTYEIEPGVNWVEMDGSADIRIEDYRRPEFAIQASDSGDGSNNEAVTIQVAATYLFGKPVSAGTVRWKLVRQPNQTMAFPRDLWDELYGNGYAWNMLRGNPQVWPSARYTQNDYSAPANLNGVEIEDLNQFIRGTNVLDADGTCRITVKHPETLRKLRFNTLEVEVADLTNRVERESLPLDFPTVLSIRTNRGYCVEGEAIQTKVAALDAAGNEVLRECLVEVLSQDGRDEDQADIVVASERVQTTTTGPVTLSHKLTQPGRSRLRVSLIDHPDVTAETDVIVLPSEERPNNPFMEADLRAEFVENAPGTSANLLISGPTSGATVLLFLRSQAGFVETPQILTLNGHSLIVPVELQQRDCPGVSARAVMMGDGKLQELTCSILVPPVTQRLEIQLDSLTETPMPGDTAKLKLTAVDSQGNPAAAHILIAAYDESLDQIEKPSPESLIWSFYWRIFKQDESWYRSFSDSRRRNPRGSFLPSDGEIAASLHNDFFGSILQRHSTQIILGGFGGGFGMGGGGFGVGGMGGGGMADPQAFEPPEGTVAAGNSQNLNGHFIDPRLRTNWRDTAFFSGELETDLSGQLTFEIPLPDNLTTWKVRAWAIDDAVRVGFTERSLQTSRRIMIRPHVPRHLTSGDEISISAAIYNSFTTDKTCRVSLKSGNELVRLLNPAVQDIKLAPNTETIATWEVSASDFGVAELTFSAQTDEDADAAQLAVPVNPRGQWSNTTRFAALKQTSPAADLEFEIPADRMPGKARLDLHWGSTIPDSIRDALPFLIEYPHGCAEQTTNRFVPLALAHRAATDFPQLRIAKPPVTGKQESLPARDLPDEATFRRMLHAGTSRLEELQNSDGGWSWFGTPGISSPDLTAQVVYGLFLAKNREEEFSDGHLRGIDLLTRLLEGRRKKLSAAGQSLTATDSDVWMAFVLSQLQPLDQLDTDADIPELCREILVVAARDSDNLTSLGIVLAGLAAQSIHDPQLTTAFIERADQLVARDTVMQTVTLQQQPFRRGGWFEGASETLGRYLQLKVRNNKEDPDINWIVRGLLTNRQSTMSWENTRDTAVAIEAMIELLQTQNADAAKTEFDILLDGQLVKAIRVSAEDPQPATKLSLDATQLSPGHHTIALRHTNGPDLDAMLVSREFRQTVPSGQDRGPLRIERNLYRISREPDNHRVGATEPQRTLLKKDDSIAVGDIIEVELIVSLQSEIEYLMIQSPHGAGFEIFQVPEQFESINHHEARDNRLELYADSLPVGTHSFRYQIRVEHRGHLWINPAHVGSMYFDQFSASSQIHQIHCK